jgi:serine/threonine-protein kinase
MEYIEGPSLSQVLKEEGRLPSKTVSVWLRQAADALGHAHRRGVMHCDIKSANLLLERVRDRVYVSDFGLARAAEMSGGSSSGDSSKTLTGTAAYRAPEVRKTGHTAASDLYSLGVVGYELLAGRRPFEGSDPLDLLMAHATDAVPELPEDVPGWMRGVVMRLLAKEPGARYASGEEVVEALSKGGEGGVRAAPRVAKASGDAELVDLARRAAEAEQALVQARAEAAARAAAEEAARKRAAEKAALEQRIEAAAREAARLRASRDPLGALEQHGFEWVTVPAGEFTMGSNDYGDEKPIHRVHLSAYQIARHPVTNAQYELFVKATSYATPKHWKNGKIPAGKEKHPVVNVSWQDAQAFCVWAGVRLPTEAEWEKAARGADGRKYPWGNEPPTMELCNFNGNVGDTTPVGLYPKGASPYGVLDMAGNVREWVSDWYDEKYYSVSPGSNPPGPATGTSRVLRGGSWASIDLGVRSANRFNNVPVFWLINLGFRCVRSQ